MKKTEQGQQMNLNIDINQSTPIVCDNPDCGNDTFMPVVKFRRVSKLLTGSTKDAIIPVQVFICLECGNINKEFDFEQEDTEE